MTALFYRCLRSRTPLHRLLLVRGVYGLWSSLHNAVFTLRAHLQGSRPNPGECRAASPARRRPVCGGPRVQARKAAAEGSSVRAVSDTITFARSGSMHASRRKHTII
uniref:Putative secreted protein n=1 Tax=Ixodes ricinus TaxID=34613 RepID=A0A6B0UDX1_IXORI